MEITSSQTLTLKTFPYKNKSNEHSNFCSSSRLHSNQDDALIALNGGFFWGPGGGVAGGVMQGAAANRLGVQLDAGMAGIGFPASVGRMLAGQ